MGASNSQNDDASKHERDAQWQRFGARNDVDHDAGNKTDLNSVQQGADAWLLTKWNP